MRLYKITSHHLFENQRMQYRYSLEIDCGPQNDTFLIGEADGQQTNYQICLKHLH